MNALQVPLFILLLNFGSRDIILLVGLTLITTGLMMRLRKKKMRQKHDRPMTPDEHVEKVRQAKGVRADLEDIMVDIEQMAKRLGAQLDNKAARVEALIDQADRRINELKQLHRESNSRASAAPAPGNVTADNDTTDTTEPQPPDDPLATSIYALADAGHDPIHIAQKLNQDVGKVELILALRSA